jgi:DNA mismatch repair ATPase MutS
VPHIQRYVVKLCSEMLIESASHLLTGDLPLALQRCVALLSSEALRQLQELLSSAILDTPSPTPDHFVRQGYCPQYDASVLARDEAAIGMENVAAQLRTETGISNLKLKSSGGGFFIEVPSASVRMIPSDWIKIAGRGLRYKPQQLIKFEAGAAAAAADVAAAADAVWCKIVAAVGEHSKELGLAAEVTSEVDVLQAMAEVAVTRGHVRPRIQGSGAVWDVRDGRHLVIENLMQKRGACFIPNSCYLSQPASVMLLSGANMGGKSTFLRQNALIAILAQMGAFVPASSATISVVDRLYCRVGGYRTVWLHAACDMKFKICHVMSCNCLQVPVITCQPMPAHSWSRWRRLPAFLRMPRPIGSHPCLATHDMHYDFQALAVSSSSTSWAGAHVLLKAPPLQSPHSSNWP